MFGFTMIVYIDYVLLAVLLFLTLFTCGYCYYRVSMLRRDGQVEVLLRPTKVLFSHRREGESGEQLRTVVAYQNPLTGKYCVRKSHVPRVLENPPTSLPTSLPTSPASRLSAEYEPLHLDPLSPHPTLPKGVFSDEALSIAKLENPMSGPPEPAYGDNRLTKTWNWNYKEYQI